MIIVQFFSENMVQFIDHCKRINSIEKHNWHFKETERHISNKESQVDNIKKQNICSFSKNC